MEAFMEDLRRGERLVPNPYDAKKPRLVSLKPEDVDCVVFWTRNPGPILRHLDELEAMGLPFYVQLTLTGYPRRLEPGVPPAEEVVETLQVTASRGGNLLLGIGPDANGEIPEEPVEVLTKVGEWISKHGDKVFG